jgi:hypothetical protein
MIRALSYTALIILSAFAWGLLAEFIRAFPDISAAIGFAGLFCLGLWLALVWVRT